MELTEEKDNRLKHVLKKNEFIYGEEPEESEGLISIYSHGKEIPILHRKGLLSVFGKTGVRKTSFLALLGKIAFSNETVGNLTANLKGGIVWIDTEQAGIEFFKVQTLFHNMCGLEDNSPRIKSYSLVELPNLEDRLDAIELAISNMENVDVLVIDGIKDLLLDSNDESTSKAVIERLRAYSVAYNCGLITVLHTDKKGHHMVGRLGTLLGEKSSYTMRLELDRGTGETIITGDKTRGKKFKPFRINHNDEGEIVIKDDNPNLMDSSEKATEDMLEEVPTQMEAARAAGGELLLGKDDIPF